MSTTNAVTAAEVGLIDVGLDLDYKVREGDRKQFESNQDVSIFLVTLAVNTKYGEKMPRKESRDWAEIQDLLMDRPKSLLMAKSSFDWLFEIVNDCEFPAGLSSWRWTLLREWEKLKQE